MDPIYRKIYIDLDRAEDRVKFYTVSIVFHEHSSQFCVVTSHAAYSDGHH